MALAQSKDHSLELAVSSALRTLATERDGLTVLMDAIGDGLGPVFTAAVDRIAAAPGRIIVSGMGKSGHVARKIAATIKALGADRFDMKYSAGTTSHEKMMKSIELYGTKVIPMVRELMANEAAA